MHTPLKDYRKDYTERPLAPHFYSCSCGQQWQVQAFEDGEYRFATINKDGSYTFHKQCFDCAKQSLFGK